MRCINCREKFEPKVFLKNTVLIARRREKIPISKMAKTEKSKPKAIPRVSEKEKLKQNLNSKNRSVIRKHQMFSSMAVKCSHNYEVTAGRIGFYDDCQR
jgi:hypothetical protein